MTKGPENYSEGQRFSVVIFVGFVLSAIFGVWMAYHPEIPMWKMLLAFGVFEIVYLVPAILWIMSAEKNEDDNRDKTEL